MALRETALRAAHGTADTPILYHGIPCNQDGLWRLFLRWVAEGKITPADVVDLDRNYRSRLEVWLSNQFPRLDALDNQQVAFLCTSTEPGRSIWQARAELNITYARLLPLPAGFTPLFRQDPIPLARVSPNEIVRLDEVELVTPLETRPNWTLITNRIIRDVRANGGRVITISVVQRTETRTVPRAGGSPASSGTIPSGADSSAARIPSACPLEDRPPSKYGSTVSGCCTSRSGWAFASQ